MIKTSTHILKFATKFKRNKLDELFDEYQKVVNLFIKIYWNEDMLLARANGEMSRQVDSWMLGKIMKCAYAQAIKIIKSTRKRSSKLNYKKYRYLYAKCKKKNRNIRGILDCRYSEWIKGITLRNRTTLPTFNGNVIELNGDIATIQDSKKSSEFDLWIRLGSIFGNRFSLILPTKKHKQFNKHLKNGFTLKKSVALRKDKLGRYFVDLYFEKKVNAVKTKPQKCLGIDTGINKLLSCSDGRKLGTEIKQLLSKLNRRKQGSRNYNQTLKEIKDYIGQSVNQIDFKNLDLIVMENLKGITKNTKGKTNKNLRKQLGHWNLELLFRRMTDKCEEDRVLFELVSPEYTSQQCSSCGEIHKESRNGEYYSCIACGTALDADINASRNILSRYLNGEFIVPHKQKDSMPSFD